VTGDEHYREGERLLEKAKGSARRVEGEIMEAHQAQHLQSTIANVALMAQAHFAAAQAAATLDAAFVRHPEPDGPWTGNAFLDADGRNGWGYGS
jgi:hypothetical protein